MHIGVGPMVMSSAKSAANKMSRIGGLLQPADPGSCWTLQQSAPGLQ